MKLSLILFLSLFILGCGGSSGGDDTPPSDQTPPTVAPVNVPSGATELPLLVIQVEFLDYTFNSSTLTWYNKIFGSSNGQLNHYFSEISQDGFIFTPANEDEFSVNDGFIKVNINTMHPDPADGISDFDINIANPALALANSYVDFSTYDTNNNSRIDKDELQIMFLVAGGEQATSVHPGIWAHMFCINGQVFDGVSVMQCDNGSYTAFGERHFDINGADASIGIIAHELGHGVFYLPDLYDVDNTSKGIGHFGLMGSGSWGYVPGQNSGGTPVHMSAWSKTFSNFTVAEVISADNNYEVVATHLSAYKTLRLNTSNLDEYFLIENRSALGYDAGLYALDNATFQGGLAIWHIDETQLNNTYPNSVDTTRLVDLEEADVKVLDTVLIPNAYNNYGDRTNLYYDGNGNFTDISIPSDSKLNDGFTATGISITNPITAGTSMFVDVGF